MAARALWKAVIEIGPMNVPVKLYTAVRPQQIHFRMLHDQDNVPIRQVLECPVEKKEVPREHVVKGYEIRKGQYLVMSETELDNCGPVPSRTIAVREFVDLKQIDPLYFEKHYYLGPDAHGEHGYGLLLRTLEEKGQAGIVEYVLRGKQYLGAIRPYTASSGHKALSLVAMRYADEVLLPAELVGAPAADGAKGARAAQATRAKVGERELKMAEQLVESLSARFDPTQYQDEYRGCVMEMIRRKAGGEEVPAAPVVQKPVTRGQDLAAVLRASLEHVKKGRRRNASAPVE